MNFENTFGETVKKLREEKHLPLREVAKALEIDTSMLGKIEKNNRKPTKKLIEKLAKFYGVNDRDLMIAFVSDTVAYRVLDEVDFVSDVFKVAEQKVEYLRAKKTNE